MEENISNLDKTINETIKKCPWIKSQSCINIIKFIKEELNEVIEALESDNTDNLEEEIGDLLFTILLFGKISEKEKNISFLNSINRINNKIIKRSPHVFGEITAETPEEALDIWNAIKHKEYQINAEI